MSGLNPGGALLEYHPVEGVQRNRLTDEQVAEYNEKGYTFPVDIFTPAEAAANREYFNWIFAEASTRGINSYKVENWFRRCKGMYELCTHPSVLDVVEDLLGRNLVCFRVHYFAKGAADVDEKTVTWHQDAYYWPLTPSKCVTVWVAIDDIDEDNGPMQFVPGSHLHGPIHHNPSDPDEHNVLNLTVPEPGSWGDGSVTTISPLRAGQASLHSDLLLHSSDANSSSRRRCGVALTYHTTDVRLNNPDARAAMEGRSFVCRGVDVDGYWPQDVAPPTFDDIPQWDGRAPVWDAPMPAKM